MLQLNSTNQHIGKARRRPAPNRIRTLLINRNRPNIRGRLWRREEAGTDGTTNLQCRSIDYDDMKTTVMKLPTDFVKFTEPTLSQVSPVVAKMAHTDGTRVMQYQSDDQNSIKTTNMQMAMDYLEILEPALPRGFLELAEEARNVKVESGRSYYTEEVQSQGAGLTKPVFVTVVENSSPVLRKGATIAAGISTEMIPTNRSARRREPVGPQDKTGQLVLPGSDADEVGTVPTGPVGPDVTVPQIQPVGGPIYHMPPSGPRQNVFHV